MANKKEQVTKRIVTATKITTMNNRSDDTVTFVSGGILTPEMKEKRDAHELKLVATKDGNVWLLPANNGSPINLTQTYLSEEQFANIASIPDMMDRLNQYLEVIKQYSDGGINKQLSQRITVLEDSFTNIPTTNVVTTSASQSLNGSGNRIPLSVVLEDVVLEIRRLGDTPSASPISVTVISDEFVVPRDRTPKNFIANDLPGYKKVQTIRHIRMTIGGPTENSTPMIDNTNSINYFYTAENRSVISEDGESTGKLMVV